MATRLQADEPDKQSKWADIDDDEEDWVPDTVEWMDGTKSTLQPSESQPSPPKEPQPPLSRRDSEETSKQSTPSDQRPLAIVPPGKTILKPGARTLTTQSSQTKPGLNLKKAPEISSGPTKPPIQGPAKSPWAQLPPIDKVSPITFAPSMPSPQSAVQTQPLETPTDEAPVPVQSPAKEIGPDDFNRSLRDTDRGSRELFDSKSGKYEPVRGPRRPSVRNDGGFRPPSVLRRPSQTGQASQTDLAASQGWRRSGNHDSKTWGHKEGFAIIDDSHGTDSAAEGKSGSKPPWEASRVGNTGEDTERPSVISKGRLVSPSIGRHENLGQRPENSYMSYEQGMSTHVKEALQRKKEKQEEEAREEEAKKKRLEAKLAALPPVASKSVESPKSVEAKAHETEENAGHVMQEASQTSPAEPISPSPATIKSETPASDNSATARSPDVKTSRSADLTIGKAVEYPNSTAQPSEASPSQPSPIAQYDKPHAPSAPPSQPKQPLPQSPDATLQLSTILPKSLSDSASTTAPRPNELLGATTSQRTPSFERQARSWNAPHPNAHPSASWTGSAISSHTSTGGSVWGPPSNDKTLGNGAFGSEVQGIPSIHYPHSHSSDRASHGPGPIGPPASSPRTGALLSGPNSNIPSKPNQPAFEMATDSITAQKPARQPNPSPFGEAASRLPSVYTPGSIKVNYAAARTAWNNATTTIAQQDRNVSEKSVREGREAALGPEVNYKQTFVKTNTDNALERQSMTAKLPHEAKKDGIVDGLAQQTTVSKQPSYSFPAHPLVTGTKGSRFFGVGAELNQAPQVSHTMSESEQELQVSSGPNADVEQSLFSGQASKNPMVRLPLPPVQVKLPPASAYNNEAKEPAVVMPVRQKPFNRGPQPLADQIEWQDRYKGEFARTGDRQDRYKGFFIGQSQNEWQNQNRFAELLGRPGLRSPDSKAMPPGVVPSSRALMDEQSSRNAATVSLPGLYKASSIPVEQYTLPASQPISKPSDEELWDQPEHGSTPKLSLPKPRPEWTPFVPGRGATPMAWDRGHSEERRPLFAQAYPTLQPENSTTITIRLLDKPTITKQMPQKPAPPSRNTYYGNPRKFDNRKPKPQKKSGESNSNHTSSENSVSVGSAVNSTVNNANTQASKARESKWPKPSKGPRKGRYDDAPKKVVEAEKLVPNKPSQHTSALAKKLAPAPRAKAVEKESSAFTKGRFEALGDAQMA